MRPPLRSVTALPEPLLPPSTLKCTEPSAAVSLLTVLYAQFTVASGSNWSAQRNSSGQKERSMVTTAPGSGLFARSRQMTVNWPIGAGTAPLVPTSEMHDGAVSLMGDGSAATAVARTDATRRTGRQSECSGRMGYLSSGFLGGPNSTPSRPPGDQPKPPANRPP
jgi:hypothetical protein